jgi:L-asparaginase II
MENPVLVEVIRGPLVESRHRGAVAVSDAEGQIVFAIGDLAVPVFPRSAVKALQALPLIEQGAVDRFSLSDEELALACASHSGEAAHVAGVEWMLAKAGFKPSDLRCGAHWPIAQAAAAAMARSGAPSPLHNNCSGKHAGFLCVARALGVDHADYWRPEHPVQHLVRSVLEDFTGAALGETVCAIDGCSVPTWAAPLRNLAHGMAKFGVGRGVSAERARAVAQLRQACANKPWYGRRHRPLLHRRDAAVRRPCFCEDRRRGRLLRRAAAARAWHRAQMRRWRKPRRAGNHGSRHRALFAARRERARGD